MVKNSFRLIPGDDTTTFEQCLPSIDTLGATFENNGGWIKQKKSISSDELLKNGIGIFKIPVKHHGNYQIKLDIKSTKEISDLKIFTNRRHLVVSKLTLGKKIAREVIFNVHVSQYRNTVGETRVQDDKAIYLTVMSGINYFPEITVQLESVNIPTIHILGDSIAADDEAYIPYNPQLTWSGWGQHLDQFFENIAINNQAHNGMTTECVRMDGDWQNVVSNLKPNDFVLFHLGHNDQKRSYLAPFDGYATNIRRFIKETRNYGGIPILMTSLSRIPLKDAYGDYFDALSIYAESIKQIGHELHVPVIDLHQKSFNYLLQLIKNNTTADYFLDAAHTNDYGADLVSNWIVECIEENTDLPLARYLKTTKPILSIKSSKTKRRLDNEMPITKPTSLKLIFRDTHFLEEQEKRYLLKVLELKLIDPTVSYLHPYDCMFLGMFIYSFSQVAKPFDRNKYLGKYDDISEHEWIAPYVQATIDAHLIDDVFIENDQLHIKKFVSGYQMISMIVRNLYPVKKRNTLSVKQCLNIAQKHGMLWENFEGDKPVSRLRCYLMMVRMNRMLEIDDYNFF